MTRFVALATFALGFIAASTGCGEKPPEAPSPRTFRPSLVTDATGRPVLAQGMLDVDGEIAEGTIRFGAVLEDANGKPTIRPWESVTVRSHRTVPPRGEDSTRLTVGPLPRPKTPLTVEARLLYRSASPRVLREIMKDEAFDPEIVEMATVRRTIR